jgi:hypothetical protein
MMVHKYIWKDAIPPFDKRVCFNQELTQGSVFVDLRNGRAHRVLAIGKTENNQGMPEDAFQALLLKTLPEEELTSLRQQCKFKPGENEYVILATTETLG